jgi:four helix bundle protein
MTKAELIERNRRFVTSVLSMLETLPHNRMYDALVRQLVRSATSIGANYRAACRAKSTADFLNKLKIVEEEADETCYFLDLLVTLRGESSKQLLEPLYREANELVAIYVASIKATRSRLSRTS